MIDSKQHASAQERALFLRRVNQVRFALPLLLYIVVVAYEVQEHWIKKQTIGFDINLTAEVLFFGIMGPTAVFLVLSYILRLLQREVATANELEALNRNLEVVVAERTETLALRNAELAAANTELQQVDQMKSDFVSLVSHELRAPLTTLNGGLELALQEVSEMSPQSRRILEVMTRESARLTQLVQTILDVSQLDAGKLSLNLGPVAVMPLLQRSVDVLFPRKERPIIWQTTRHLPPLWADETYVEEIVRNLLHNAQRYSPPGTPIVIETESAGDWVNISIIDRGPGIPLAQQKHIFDRFYRRAERDRVTDPGWGLGLYFARALAEEQGGALTVTSPVYEAADAPGARFTLKLPVTAEVPDDGEVVAN